jgi:hypothetical protein
MRLRLSVLLVILYICHFSFAQTEKWQVYPSYTEAVQVEVAGNRIYAIMKGSGTVNSTSGNLVRYDIEDGSVKTYDCLHDLSDKEIAHISYNKTTDRLVIVYVNGNIDLLDADDNVYNISALKEKVMSGEIINQISHFEKKTYLSSQVGIIEVDTRECVILSLFSNGLYVYGIQFLQNKAYVSTKEGLYRIESIDNLHNQNLWIKISELEFQEIHAFSNHLYALSTTRLYYLTHHGENDEIVSTSYYFKSIKCFEKYLLCLDDGRWIGLYTYDSPLKPTIVRQEYAWYDCAYNENQLFVCDREYGLIPYKFDVSLNLFYPLQKESIFNLDSPSRDLFYHMNYVGDRLLVAGGINTQSGTYYPATFMFLDDVKTPKWTIFDEKTAKTVYPDLTHYNSVDLVQDPLDDGHFFGAVYRNGLHEYRLNEKGEVIFERLYNYTNSPLRTINVNVSNPGNYCTCTALQYDNKGNLWMANQQTDTIVRIMRPDGKWVSLFYPEVVEATNVYQYLFSSHGINFMVSHQGEPRGFFGFDTNGTLNIVDDDSHLLRTSITNQDGKTVIPYQFYCMTEDQDRQIWCGTNEGLFVITRPQDWFEDDFTFHQIKRNRNDGSGFADYLLAGVNVTCIAVDPANRKWIGTMDNGLYLVSHDGQETIYHFTADNSSLLSNQIHSIAINANSGKVMIGTDLGLCSFEEQVTESENVLTKENIVVYPNPVRPSTNEIVTIEGLVDGTIVKILSSSGRSIWSATSIGGSVRWNCCDMSGNRVASGVYHIVCNTKDSGNSVVSRIIVLK